MFITAILIALVSCKTDKSQQGASVELGKVEHYFTIVDSDKPEFLLLESQEDFDKNFHPAKTMTNSPTAIDFSKSFVAAIVLPASEYETNIVLDTAYVAGKTLHIRYDVNKGEEQRSFSSKAQVAFTINSSLAVDSVSFEGKEASVVLPSIRTNLCY
ncbi:MAG: hypothetical protein ACK5M3_15460 [Dysgonomonas sp.]